MSECVVRMEMPKHCEYCPMCRLYRENGRVWCNAANRILKQEWKNPDWTELDIPKPDWCPIICSLPEWHGRLEKAKTQMDADEPAGSWMVYKAGSKPREFWYFIEWRNWKPIIGQCDGMVFTYEGMAQHVAKKLGEGWKVIDISQEACRKAERLMAAIFAEPPKEDEHGN